MGLREETQRIETGQQSLLGVQAALGGVVAAASSEEEAFILALSLARQAVLYEMDAFRQVLGGATVAAGMTAEAQTSLLKAEEQAGLVLDRAEAVLIQTLFRDEAALAREIQGARENFLPSLGPYTPTTPGDWTDPDPVTLAEGLDDLATRLTGTGFLSVAATVSAFRSLVSAGGSVVITNPTGAGGNPDLSTSAAVVPFTPTTPAQWDDPDPTTVKEALDDLAVIVSSLVPPSAPVLSEAGLAGVGTSGVNTWSTAFPNGAYVNPPADSVNNSFQVVDIPMGVSGNEHGVYDFDGITLKNGPLNDSVVATLNFGADAFGPGGSDGGSVNDLKFLLNGVVLHTVDLLTAGAGADLNANGSGFAALSAATAVTFDNGDPFPSKTWRSGIWQIGAADIVQGYNVLKVQQTTDSGTVTTNVHEFLADGDDTATTFSGEVLDTPVETGSLELSGVEYHTGATALYDITVNNAYQTTYKDGSAITFNETNVNGLANEVLAASVGDEGKTHGVLNKGVTVSSGRKINATITVSTSVDRTVQPDISSAGVSIAGFLIDSTSASATDLLENFDDETYRNKGNDDFNTNLGQDTWDSTLSLVGADANHNDGLQVTEGGLYYPGGASISNYATARAPAGNPTYAAAAGVRYWWRLFTFATGANTFQLDLGPVAGYTLISDATAFGVGAHNKIKVACRWPTQTGWLDLAVNFSEGSFGTTSEVARFGLDNGDTLTHGCRNLTQDSGDRKGITIGTKSSSSSFDKLFVRVITNADFGTNSLPDVTVTWNT